MKKIFIPLLFFSGIAVGGTTVRISSYGDNSSSITDSAASSSVTATSLINLENLKKIVLTDDAYKDTALLGIKIGSQSDYSISVGSYTVENVVTSQLRFYTAKSAGETISGAGTEFSWLDDSGDQMSYTPRLNEINLEGAVKGAITLGYNSSTVSGVTDVNKGTAVVFSVLYENGDVLSYFGINNSQQWYSGHVASITYDSDVLDAPTISVWSETPWTSASLIKANEAVLIPEPAAATLSLLALCGLAARRRRR